MNLEEYIHVCCQNNMTMLYTDDQGHKDISAKKKNVILVYKTRVRPGEFECAHFLERWEKHTDFGWMFDRYFFSLSDIYLEKA